MSHIFEAIESKCDDTLRQALLTPKDINVQDGAFKETPLHRAAKIQWKNGLIMLLARGCEVHSNNYFNQTALHYAVASQSMECFRVILEKGNEDLLNQKDSRGHSALHDATILGLADMVEELVAAGALVNVVDIHGSTPLHKAVGRRDVKSIHCLLKAGADIKAKDYQGRDSLSLFIYFYPDIFETILDECFTDDIEKGLNKTRIQVEFYPLLRKKCHSQLDVIRDILMSGSSKIISHSLIESFLLLQWLSLRRFYVTEVVSYFIFTILATILILNKFIWKRVGGNFPQFVDGTVYDIFFYVVCFGAILMLMRQCFIVVHGIKLRLISSWYILNFIIPICVLIVVPGKYTPWQDHLAAITLLLAWSQGMLHIGRFPKWGIYIAMFESVARNLMRIFLIFLCVFIAFALSFNIICFSQHSPITKDNNGTTLTYASSEDVVYSSLWLTFIKTLTMMLGEINFDESLIQVLNYLPGTSHCILVAFIFLMSIILSNLLVALAVSDVEGLKDKAKIEKLFKQAELAELMETTCEVVCTILGTLFKVKFSRQIYLPSYISEQSNIYISTNDHNNSGCLVVSQKPKMKIVSISTHFIESVKACLKKVSERKRAMQLNSECLENNEALMENKDMERKEDLQLNLETSLAMIKNNVQLLNENLSLVLQKITLVEEKLDKLT